MSLWEVLEPGVLRSPPDGQPCSTAQASPTPAAWHCPEVWSVSGEGGPPGPLRAGPRETRGEDDVETEEARLPRSHGAGPWTQDDPPTCAQTEAGGLRAPLASSGQPHTQPWLPSLSQAHLLGALLQAELCVQKS